VYQLDGPALETLSSIESGSGFKCSSFGASSISQPQLAVGGCDGKLQLWDFEQQSRTPLWDVQAHASIVNGMDGFGGQVCVCVCCVGVTPPVRVGASTPDGCHQPCLGNSNTPVLPSVCLAPSRTAQAFGYGPPELVTCGRDGCVRVWDVRQRDAPVAAFEPADDNNVRQGSAVCRASAVRVRVRGRLPAATKTGVSNLLGVCLQGLLVRGHRQLAQR
jgi:WD40 repeat protein